MDTITVGDIAPDFSLTDRSGTVHSLSAAPAKYKVVFFYPKDNTPGCTIEAKEFSQSLDILQRAGAAVFGISGGSDRTKAAFCAKHGLTVPLLSDPDFAVAKVYGAYGSKSFMGRIFNGVHRKTFVIGSDGRIAKIFTAVRPAGHVQEVIDVLRRLDAGEPVSSDLSTP